MRTRKCLTVTAAVILLLCIVFLIYTGQYCHADETAAAALRTNETVRVEETGYGWFFDGPSETDALIFYPGGKVEETAYAPLLHDLAGQGMDVCLVKMPFRLAVFGKNKADQVIQQYDYTHWYIGGHSLGGVMAADYAAGHSSQLTGVFMLAAYPSKQLDENTRAVQIYGSEDGVLNMAKLEEAERFLPAGSQRFIIEGGNHAQFGNYGKQDGDGDAAISSEEQQKRTVEIILQNR
ncbi:MAG: alpha/beta hydrolase [Solobacterium sp.]|nr:alpha/beta hydrolase [Solobacterium sp.]